MCNAHIRKQDNSSSWCWFRWAAPGAGAADYKTVHETNVYSLVRISILATVFETTICKWGCHKGNENDPKKTAENGISQQPINENGIRFLRMKRFWNPRTCEERKTILRHVFPSFSVSTNRDWAYIIKPKDFSQRLCCVNNKLTNRFEKK